MQSNAQVVAKAKVYSGDFLNAAGDGPYDHPHNIYGGSPFAWMPTDEHGNVLKLETVCRGVALNCASPGETIYLYEWGTREPVYEV